MKRVGEAIAEGEKQNKTLAYVVLFIGATLSSI